MAEITTGKTNLNALITGITGNVGKACAETLLPQDWFVHGVSRSVKYSNTENYQYEPFDLNKSWSQLQLWCNSNHYKYDLVVMAHGTQRPCTLQTMTEDNWFSILYDNLASCIGLTQALVKMDKLESDALIVFCSSIQASNPRNGRGLYGACKAGLETFSKAVAVELAPVRSITLRLGQLTETMANVVFTASEKGKLQQRSLLPWVQPGDVADLISDLYWQKSLTATTITLDGGHTVNCW